jgi:hypothetical protein
MSLRNGDEEPVIRQRLGEGGGKKFKKFQHLISNASGKMEVDDIDVRNYAK